MTGVLRAGRIRAGVAVGGVVAGLLMTGAAAGRVATAAPTGPWEPVQPLVDDVRVDPDIASVVVAPGGRAVAAWLQGPNSHQSVLADLRAAGAAGWAGPVVLSGAENPFDVVAAAHGGGQVTVGWEAFDQQGDGQVWTRTLSRSGGWSPRTLLADFEVKPGQGAVVDVEIATRGGAAVMAWKQRDATWTSVRSPDGDWRPARPVPHTDRGSAVWGVAVDTDGTVAVVGNPDDHGREVDAWRRPPDGPWHRVALGMRASLTGREPSVDSSPAGDLAVGWTRRNDEGDKQAVLRTRPAGGGWSSLQALPAPSRVSDLALTGSGAVTLFWERQGDTVTGELEWRTLAGQLQWRHAFGDTTGLWAVLDGMSVGAGGRVVVDYLTSRENGQGDLVTHRWTVRCATDGDCEHRSRGHLPAWYRSVALDVDRAGAATFVWDTGSRGEEGLPTGVASKRLLAP